MTTEQIDLASVKRIINNVWELKKQVQILSEKLTVSENERQNLADLLSSKEERFNTEISQLKSDHSSTIQKQEQSTKQKIDQLVNEYANEKTTLIESYEKKLETVTTELQQKNATLQQSIEKLSQENQAITNRIRGIIE